MTLDGWARFVDEPIGNYVAWVELLEGGIDFSTQI